MNKHWFKISENEITRSWTAKSKGIDNYLNDEIRENVDFLIKYIWFPLRVKYGSPITVNSCYRSPELNKVIGGSKNSDHMKGLAFDLSCKDYSKLLRLCLDLPFKQLIIENIKPNKEGFSIGWVHIAIDKDKPLNEQKKEILTMKRVDGKVVYEYVSKEYVLNTF